ncbi:related to DNA repair protein Nse1 [Phialocephala subalpina]|uniref:Non-structural maintenance of chromosomes element 1 homolog n=1 Tax=Phialocephala subalpina TaxID=576137 RepID=A0A1L7XGL7_9HELO|nr:related to DNA repair protein Nse1 [Phialocephala subalpina]
MSDAGDVAQYNDGNRAFLQSFLARGTLTMEEAKPMIAAILSIQAKERGERVVKPDDVTKADLDYFIEAAAEAISPLDYEIRSTQHQVSRDRVWALVNSVSDPLTQLSTIHTADEIYYIKRFLDAMFDTYNTKRREVMAVNDMQALETKLRKGSARQSNGGAGTQPQGSDKGLTTSETEKLLRSLIDEKWILRGSKSGYYTLTPRALMELRSWLVDTYNDPDEPDEWQKIKFCMACKDIVTIGQRCADLECNARLHNICEGFWTRRDKTCPKCKTAWDGKHFVGPKAITTRDDQLRAKRSSGVGKRRRADVDEDENSNNGGEGPSGRRRRTQIEEEPEEEDEEEEEPDEEPEDEEPEEEHSPIRNRGSRRKSNHVVEEEASASGSDE